MTSAPLRSTTTSETSSFRRGGTPSSTAASPAPSATTPSSRTNAAPFGSHPRELNTVLYDQNASQHRPATTSDASPSKQGKANNRSAATPSASSPLRRKANMSSDKAEKRRSSRACLECRLAKTKCHVTGNKDICDRCAKFSFECRFVRHHRGRKPVSKLASVEADDLDAGAGSSRLGMSDDDMASDHDTDSANEDAAIKPDNYAPARTISKAKMTQTRGAQGQGIMTVTWITPVLIPVRGGAGTPSQAGRPEAVPTAKRDLLRRAQPARARHKRAAKDLGHARQKIRSEALHTLSSVRVKLLTTTSKHPPPSRQQAQLRRQEGRVLAFESGRRGRHQDQTGRRELT